MDDSNVPECSHDPEQVSQNLKMQNKSTVPQDQYGTLRILSGTSKDPCTSSDQPGPSNNKSDTQKDKSGILKEQSGPSKDQSGPSKDKSDTLKDKSGILKDQSGPSKEQSGPSKEQSGPSIEQSGPTKDQFGLLKEKSVTSKYQYITSKDQSGPSKDQYGPPKTQSGFSRDKSSCLKGINMERRTQGNVESPISFCVARVASSTLSYSRNNSYLSSYTPLLSRPSTQSPISTQPRLSELISPATAFRTQPPSLFIQALTKLNESSLTVSVINHLRILQSNTNLSKVVNLGFKSGEITPPDSLASAPPSYSFVLRQMAVRRRPRLMGTFIPSPSFVQHTPPPTYTTAFDVYIEPVPPPPPRVYTFGFASMPIVCPECGYTGMTVVTCKITLCTHLCAFILCVFCCWICAPLPYVLRSCKDVYHYCRNCRCFLGMYCPTNPDGTYP